MIPGKNNNRNTGGEAVIRKGFTYEEIMGQAGMLEAIYGDVLNGNAAEDLFGTTFDEVVLFGCGTDYNICQSAAFYSRALLPVKNFFAVPSSELLLNTETYIQKNKKYLAVGFSRSGQTTESIDVLKKLKKNSSNISTFVFSAREDSTIIKISDRSFVCSSAREKSVAMTKAYTGFLYAYCLMLAKYLDRKENMRDFAKLVGFFNKNLGRILSDIEDLQEILDFKRYFVLGSGFNYGIAVEADLKMKEMAATDAYSYHIHEFIHGPKTLVDDKSLCLILASDYFSPGLAGIFKELSGFGSRILSIGYENVSGIKNQDIRNIETGMAFENGFAKSFTNIPVFQLLAYAKAVKTGLNPDLPRNLNFTTRLEV